jgi:hypothetical protein
MAQSIIDAERDCRDSQHQPQDRGDQLPVITIAGSRRMGHIQRVITECGGNVSRLRECSGIHRRSLQRKLSNYQAAMTRRGRLHPPAAQAQSATGPPSALIPSSSFKATSQVWPLATAAVYSRFPALNGTV